MISVFSISIKISKIYCRVLYSIAVKNGFSRFIKTFSKNILLRLHSYKSSFKSETYNNPLSAKLKKSSFVTIMWSKTFKSRYTAAVLIFSVNFLSASLGIKLPLGWL